MTWANFVDNIAFYSGTSSKAGVLSAADRTAILGYLEDLYASSTTAAAAMDSVIASAPLVIAEAIDEGPAFTSHPSHLVAYNLGCIDDLYYFNQQGKLVKEDARLTMIHEIFHLSLNVMEDLQEYTEAYLNGAAAEHQGPVVFAQNIVAAELGLASNVQASYLAHVLDTESWFGQFEVDKSYTDGNTVDIVRLGTNDGADNIDHTARATELRDLIFGLDGDDILRSGAGDDYAYGGAGDDEIYGGAGNDVLYGEADDDIIQGGDGDDFLDGGAGINTLDGGEGFDIASFLSASTGVSIDLTDLTLNHSATGNTLISIESLVLTNQDDVVDFSRADACIASMGGDDTVNIYCNETNVEEWSHALFWAPGEGADVLNFQDWEFNYQAYPWVFILDGEADDQIQFNGMNIADVIGRADAGASVTSSSHTLFTGWYYWCVLDGQSNVVEQLTLGVSLPGEEWQGVHLSYESYVYDANSQVTDSESFDVFLGKFDSGDFGITTGESYAPDDLRTDFIEVVDTYLGFPTELIAATLNSDHAWDYWVT